MAQAPAPDTEKTNPYMPPGPQPLVFEDFMGGLNTDASRPAVADNQMAWCDGWFPHGKSSLRTLPDLGDPIYDGGSANSVANFDFANIGAAPLCIVFGADGSLTQVNTDTSVQTPIAPAGTILTPTPGNAALTQYGSQFIIIVSAQPNGYFIWDGTVFYAPGGLAPTITLTAGGSGYVAPVATITGGSGSGAVLAVTTVGGVITAINIVSGGTGYLASDTIAVSITDGSGIGATATAELMPFGINGTTAETYKTRVWVANGARIQFTAPESAVDFSTANGGGSFVSSDSFLRVGWSRLLQTNGFLYLIADSSINYISTVTTTVPQSGPPVTTFSNQNANPEVGTPYGDSVDVFSENIVFVNAFGAQVSYGGRVTKISEDVTDTFDSVPNFGGVRPSSAKAIIFGKRVWMFLIPAIDIITGQVVSKFFLWNGKIWFTSQQSKPIYFIQSQEINSVLTAYGSDNRYIYPLFVKPSVALKKTVQSKLWGAPGGYMFTKTASRLWGLAAYFNLDDPNLTISVDNELGTAPTTISVGPEMTWINNVGAPIVWSNGTTLLTWLSTAGNIVVFKPQAVGQTGALTGLTISTNCAAMELISISLGEQVADYRG